MKEFNDYGIKLNKSAGHDRVSCPNCTPNRKHKNKLDLSVNIDDGVWFCHHCGWKGGLSQGAKKQEYSFTNFKNKYVPPKTTIYDYFKLRGISQATLDRNLVGQEQTYINGKNVNAIAFRYYLAENLVNIKYRTKDKQFSQIKNGGRCLYKINDITTVTECIITEGEIDALSYEEAGLMNAVSIPDGAINPGAKNIQNKMEFLNNCREYLSHVKKYYISCDNDAPGRAMSEELARRIGKSKCYLIKYPENCKDANDVLVNYGKEKLIECYNSAEPYPVQGIYYAKDRERELYDIYENGLPVGPLTGKWSNFDKLIKHHDSNLVIITGTPESGKTTFLDNWLMNLAHEHDYRFGIFSPENKKFENHIFKLCQVWTGKEFLPGNRGRMTKKELDSALKFINEHIYTIKPPGATFTLKDIIDAADYLVKRFGIKGLVVDSWMKLAHLQESGENFERYHTRILNELTEIGIEYGINIYLVAHPTKIATEADDPRNYQVARMHNISGSHAFYDIADLGISVRRVYTGYDMTDYSQSHNEIHVLKVREDFMGVKGVVNMEYDTESRRFSETLSPPIKENYDKTYMPKTKDGYPLDWDKDELF